MSYADALRLLASDEPIARDDVRRWIESGDLLTWSVVYTLTGKAWSRIQPDIPLEEQIDFMRRYLLRCIDEQIKRPNTHRSRCRAAVPKRWRREGTYF